MIRLSTKAVRKNFESAISTALRIYGPVRGDCIWNYESINENTFHPRVASKVIGLSFLSIVAAWEEYLENSFLRYMTGALSETGYAPRLRIGPCKSTAHAKQVLTSTVNTNEAVRFMRWNDFEWVLAKAEIFFYRAEPYSRVDSHFLQRLKDAQIIRNRVAHSSSKARSQFKTITNRNVGAPKDSPMDYGFSPGRYLIYNKPEVVFGKSWVETKHCEWPDIFECYVHMFTELVYTITPHKEYAINAINPDLLRRCAT
ncbi:MAG: hypothetical protein ABSB32_08740 [Thermodesulfobacteriota bacterium]|jgi:hypothetical protein